MTAIRRVWLAFIAPTVPTHVEEAKQRSDRRIVSAHSNGNIRLQKGQYSTKKEIDRQYERVRNHNFEDA